MTVTAPTETGTSPTEVGVVVGRPAPGGIVVGVDGSDSSLEALRWALDEGVLRHVGVHVVLSWAMPPVLGMAPVQLPSEEELDAGARGELARIVADHAGTTGRPADSPVTSAVMEGSPARELLLASEQASLLVVGTRGHGGFAGLLLGSVSQQCAAHATCPVVVVHEGRSS